MLRIKKVKEFKMKVIHRSLASVALALSGLTAGAWAEEGSAPWSISMTSAWDSRYVSEGRDNLDGDALVGGTVELETSGVLAGAWYGSSPDTEYDEMNLYVEYGAQVGDVALAAGYTWLSFRTDDEDDHELFAGVAYDGLPGGVRPSVEATWSAEADGGFVEASLSGVLDPVERLAVEPFVTAGFNEGYVSDGHDGFNHVAAGLAAAVSLAEGVELSALIAYTWAVNADETRHPGDAGLEDFAYGGIAITMNR